MKAARHTFKKGEHVVHHFGEDDLKGKLDHSILFDGFVVKSLVDPALAKKEKDDFVTISHREVLKLTPQQKVHVEKKRIEEATKSLEKMKSHSSATLEKKSLSHLLSDHDNVDVPTEIYYHQRANYVEYSTCGTSVDVTEVAFGIELDKCFRCKNEHSSEERGCKATVDYMNYMVNYTSYESLTCDDSYYWMDRVTDSWPTNECVYNAFRHDILYSSISYADPNGGFTNAFYNNSDPYCHEAPIYYLKHLSASSEELCLKTGEQGSIRVDRGCEYQHLYHNDHCSGPAYQLYPMKSIVNKCRVHDESENLPFFVSSHEIHLDHNGGRSFFCGLGQPERPICLNENGLPCQDVMDYINHGFVGVPSPSARVCKPHNNDDQLRVEFVHMAQDPVTQYGMIKLAIKTPDDVSLSDRFRVVMKLFDNTGQKETFNSFKFNGIPENKTLTFQKEGMFAPSIHAREVAVKIKQRVFDEDRAFIRKSCVRFAFPGDEEEEGHNDRLDPNQDQHHSPSYSPTSGQPSGQPFMEPTGKPSSQPSNTPSAQPSSGPSSQPSCQPSGSPTAQPPLAP